jgi:uncharacterized Zn-finger protein
LSLATTMNICDLLNYNTSTNSLLTAESIPAITSNRSNQLHISPYNVTFGSHDNGFTSHNNNGTKNNGTGLQKPYKCSEPDCQKAFGHSTDLSRHRREVHLRHKPHQCPSCAKPFPRKARLVDHYRVIHLGEKGRRRCLKDGSDVPRELPMELELHMRRHTIQKSYPCIACGKSYTRSASLDRHRREKHSPTTS